jgi:hypothetical protein
MTTATRPRKFQPGSHGYARQVRSIVREALQPAPVLNADMQRRAKAGKARP